MRRRLACRIALVAAFASSSAVAEIYPLQVPLLPDAAKVEVQGKLEFLDVERVQSSSPYQNPQGKLRLHLIADLSSRLQFVGDLTGTAGGTPRNAHGAGVYDFGHALQDISPSLEFGEGYLDFRGDSFDLRAGLQKFAWGKLDARQPNDLLNPQKFYDPILEEENDRKNGVPAIAPTVDFPETKSPYLPSQMRLTFVWQPIFVPYYFPDDDERWYPPLGRAPAESDVMGFTVKNSTRFVNSDVPSRTWAHGTYAARFAGLWCGADFALYYFDGTDTAPALDAHAVGFVKLDPTSGQILDVTSDVDVFPKFDRIRAAGGDVAYRLFDATLRVEAAYISDRDYTRSINDIVANETIDTGAIIGLVGQGGGEVPVTLAPANVRRDGVEWGAGGDRFVGDTFVLLQMNQTVVLHNDVNLIISDYETRFATTVRRGFLDDRLTAELAGLYGMQGVYGVAHPHLSYSLNDHVDLRVGYLMIEGHSTSMVGQYRKNDEGYVRVRYLF
jgi:hypothetical protein